MNILQLSAHFRPNIGGVETHLDDLCKVLLEKKFRVFVLTYRPLHTKAFWKIYEKNNNLEIIRIPWIPNMFYKLIGIPFLEFIYLLPGLFFVAPFVIFLKRINLIHAHGLVAGFVGVFWGWVFKRKVVISTHSIYNFPKEGLYRGFVKFIFENSDYNFGLSRQAENEIRSLVTDKNKVGNFTYWIDLKKFKKIKNGKSVLGWKNKFVVLFVGRLVPEKGILELLQVAKIWNNNISLKIIGAGPLEKKIESMGKKNKNFEYLGKVENDELPIYYSGADVLVIPSTHEEGFGRVILESLSCGTPIIGSKRGSIPEVIDKSVGVVIDINSKIIKNTVEYFYLHPQALSKLSRNCRRFAERRYSEKNAQVIINAYGK
ncbi:MAG: glycosyltransferase family 4 protein [Candidatus Daviesbacteria bacterium]|nr:glycosyltransferase family 4 protein [Candidatus Daviesbacteria bacterium]